MSRSTFHNKRRNYTATWLIVLSFTLTLMVSVVGVAQAAGTVTGLVFRDYNANGTQDANEPGVGGVTITAYGAAGTVVGSATSSAALGTLGSYSISWVSADARVRLEFSSLPGVAQQGAFGAGGSGTSVQFVNTGAVANYGINRPSDYCLATPNLKLVTTCFELGAQTSGTARVVVSHDYAGPPFGPEATVAFDNQVGTTWGVAYKRGPIGSPTGSGTIYVSAFAKRQAEYGPNGSGAIYAINGAVANLLTVIPNAGVTVHNNADYRVDSTFYAAPGKEGLGDMDISEDGNTLFVVNLFDRNLYSINIATGVATARGIIGPAACTNGVYRPFGLGIRDGLVYVGGVCDASAEPVSPTMSNSLQAYVYSFNPATNTSAQVLTFPLNYPRGCADIDPTYGNPGAPINCRTTATGSQADWQPWRDTWPNPNQTPPGSGFSGGGGDEFFAYPQPILSGIEFVGEDMVVSFRDRMGDQIGYRDNGPDGIGGVFPDTLVTITAGDILRAGPNGAGGWTIENAAQGVDFGPSVGANIPYSEQGPGNGEFYWQDNFTDGTGVHHDETITGGIVQVPGAPEISAELMDPNDFFSAGTGWFDNGTGARNRQFTIIPATAPFGKGNGLGDLAALCDSAPIEIGNYVWFDANQNGIQDANEQPIAGVQVQLVNPITNAVIATATTNANGQYIFSSNPTNPSPGNPALLYGLPITENTNYQVRIDTTQPNLTGYTTTTPNAGGVVNDVRDSNGLTAGSFAIANVTTGTAGQNNHTLDFGFFTPPYSLGNRIWFDDGRGGGTPNDGIQNGTEPGIDGVTVNLLDSLGNIVATTVTTAGGYYRFDNLAPGSYTVEIPASNFAAGAVLAGMNSSADAPTSATPNNDIDRDDNGVILLGGGGVRSNPIQLGPPGPLEPSNETDLGPGGSGTATNDHSNLTVDFGFFLTPVTTYSLGNRVWLDSNDSGTIDGAEIGIGGVVVNLYPVTGGVPAATPSRTVTTDANGYYLFDNLPAGDYVVEIPASNFGAGGSLAGLRSSTPDETDPNADVDSNDNGIGTGSSGVRSGTVSLGTPVGTEPTGETDIGPQGSGIAANDHSNLTVDFGFVGTPSSGSGAAPIRLDPAIVKLVDPAFAQPGEDVRWTIVVTNPHSVPVNNVSFVDNFPSQLQVISASADSTVGSLVVSGNSVSYSIVVINPGQSVRVRVLTRIRLGTPVPFIITNTVNLVNGGGSATSIIASASASVASVGSLPLTGFAPVWREPLLVGIAVLLVLFGVGSARAWRRGYGSS